QVWVERGDTPLIRKLVMTYKARPSSPQFRAVFLEWDLNAITTDQEFVFEPGPDTERIPTLAQPLRFQEVE
ncbi:MAG: DUF2092 domain-containing protein, partial [Akkermansiaceae bacterium]|nr:DUF2092 domain-containing protein [Akkermansiaceae bacterium]